jgi:hypothetical protein
MQVNVFVSEVRQDGEPTQMLVLPFGPEAAIPAHLQGTEWRYFATTEADDKIINLPQGEVEVAIAADGYLVVTPQPADRR